MVSNFRRVIGHFRAIGLNTLPASSKIKHLLPSLDLAPFDSQEILQIWIKKISEY